MVTLREDKVLILSQYFYPESFRINDIALEFTKRGLKVAVVTGVPNYPQGKFYKGYSLLKRNHEKYHDIIVKRLPIFPRMKSKVTLFLNYISFVISGFFWAIFERRRFDFVFNFNTSPIFQALPGIWYSRKRKIPFYIYVQDLWPDVLRAAAGISNEKILRFVNKVVKYIYNKSNLIFVTSLSFKQTLEARGVSPHKVIYLPQYPEEFYKPIKLSKSDDKTFKIVYTGNIGYAQGLDILVDAAKFLKGKVLEKRMIFKLVGDGRYKDILIKKIEQNDVKDLFDFTPMQPPEKIPEILASSDVAFLSYKDDPLLAMTIPAKLQTYLACGIPILAVAGGETKRIIEEARCGICVEPGGSEKLVQAILDLACLSQQELVKMGENGLVYCKEHFSKEKIIDRLLTYIQKGGQSHGYF